MWNGRKAAQEIRRLNREINKLNEQKRILQERIEEIKVGETPIKVGMIIVWPRGNAINERKVRGKVIRVSITYNRNFEYRVQILSKMGKPIGFASVTDAACPELEPRQRVATPKK